MQEQEVITERRDSVLIITINRPQARNALNRAVAEGVRDAVDELDADGQLRAAVLTGAGGTFSAGMDLKAFLNGESPSFAGRGLCGITETPPRKPLLAAVEGWALAGGFELVLACDLVIASRSARFGVPEVKRSLVAAAGGALLLPRRLPLPLALELLLTGDPIDAERAAQVGLVNRVVAEGGALAARRGADLSDPLTIEPTPNTIVTFAGDRPAQLVAGTGGDIGEPGDTPRMLDDTVSLDGMSAKRFGLPRTRAWRRRSEESALTHFSRRQ